MDYSSENIKNQVNVYEKEKIKKKNSNKKHSNKKKSNKKKSKTKLKIMRVVISTFIISLFAVFGAALGTLMGIIQSAPDLTGLELKPTTDYTSFIYDQNGQEMDRLSGGENRIYATLDEIPLYLQQAVIATEDERFYEHNGIDLKGIVRAIITNLKSGEFTEGASTITQQLIKNNILTSKKKITRKLQEQYLAIQFEKIYEEAYGNKGAKDLILEYYLNTMPLGRGTNGVQAAANRYFNKDVSKLTLAESVVLACITQAPTRYDPITNPENNYEKSKIILEKMVEGGYISTEEKEVALAENPYKLIHKENEKYLVESNHSYFVDAVIEEVIEDLQVEKGMSPTEANNLLFGGGVKIYTTFDHEIQSIVDQYISDDSLYPSKAYELKVAYSVTAKKAEGSTVNLYGEGIVKSEEEIEGFKQAKHEAWGLTNEDKIEAEKLVKIPQPQSAFVIMDHRTGQVKALSGGRGDKAGDRTFNRVTQAKRQPGSVFKILSTYAPAIDKGLVSPGTILIDEPITINLPSGPYSPRNWDSNYRGPVSVRQAIWHSINSVTVKTLQEVGINTAYDYLLDFGFTTLSEADKGYALALGGLSEGVTPLELNAAIGAIANGGIYVEPILYTKIVDRDGNVILEKKPKTHRVISEATATMLTDMMEDVIKKGTGGSLTRSFSGMPVAGKTGTTNDDKDFLFAGYTPYYTATIWLGHDQPKRVIATGREHLKIWGSIMNTIHKDLPYKDFDKLTTGYIKASVCTVSGKIPTKLCQLDTNHTISTDYFNKNEIPKEPCDKHVEVKVCTLSGKIASVYCPLETVEVKVGTLTEGMSEEEVCLVHTSISEPEEIVLPEGVEPPEGVELPEGVESPEGIEPPKGGESLEGGVPSEGMASPEGIVPSEDEEGFYIPQS